MSAWACTAPAAILATIVVLKAAAPASWSAGTVGTAVLEALLAMLWLHPRTARVAGGGTAVLAVVFAALALAGWPAPARLGGCGCLGPVPIGDPGRLGIAGLLMASVAFASLTRAPPAADSR